MTNRIIEDISNFIFVADKLDKSDIIFLPGASDPAVPELAAKLYKDGYAPILLPSGGVSIKTGVFNGVKRKADIYNLDYKTDCDFYTDVLLKSDVPISAILEENKSGFTKENALFSRRITDKNKLLIKQAIICCKSFHARRCLMLYSMAFPEAEILVCPVDVYNIDRHTWHQSEYGIDRVLGELARCGNQMIDEVKEYCLCID